MDLNVEWSEPFPVKTRYGEEYRREWKVPQKILSAFFDYYKKNSFSLKSKGYGVTKKDDEWYLIETKLLKHQFKEYEHLKPKTVENDFVLLPIDVKNKEGLRIWQIDSVGKLCAAIDKWGAAIDGSQMGCHAKGQLILMSDGSMKAVENVVVGDKIMGMDNEIQTVTELHRGRQEMVRIIPTRGEPFVVNLNHILTVILTPSSKWEKTSGGIKRGSIVDVSIKDYIKLPKTTKYDLKLFSCGVEWPDFDTPFPPYLIGCLLGDGGMTVKTTVTFTNSDEDVWNFIKNECKENRWKLGRTNEEITKRITNSPNLFEHLREIGLLPSRCDTKFIPNLYKINSRKNQLDLIAGLLDTDGYYFNGGFTITLKSKRLIEDLTFMCRSVGLKVTTRAVWKKCYNSKNKNHVGLYHLATISGDCSIIPNKVKRKISVKRTQKKNALRTGFTIEMLPEDDYYGFSLDGSGRFLLGDFRVTHNTGKTYSACGVARELGMNIAVVCPKGMIYTWTDVIKNHFKMGKQLAGVINYESLRRGKEDSPLASYVRDKKTKVKKFIWKIPKDTLIIWDESQKLKGSSTQNSKTCLEALKQGYKMLFLSATAATNPLELKTLGTAIKLFNNSKEYYQWLYAHGCEKGRWGLYFNNDKEVLKKLNKDIFQCRGVRLTRDAIPSFPNSEIIAECYDMDESDTNQINKVYSEMDAELKKIDKIILKESKNKSVNRLTAILRARQRCEFIKVPLFLEMIEEGIENGMSVAVFLNFTETINALAERLNTKCIFDGKTDDDVRQKNVENFQNDKERVILINIASGGAGLSIGDQNGNFPRLAIISPTYSAISLRQSTGRVWRENSKSKSLQKIVFVSGTIEAEVCERVKQKLENLDLINDGDLEMRKGNEF